MPLRYTQVSKTIEIVVKKCNDGGVSKIFVFAATKKSVYKLYESLKELDCKVIAVSFPYKQEFTINKGEDQEEEYIPETSQENVREEFRGNNIELVRRPFRIE